MQVLRRTNLLLQTLLSLVILFHPFADAVGRVSEPQRFTRYEYNKNTNVYLQYLFWQVMIQNSTHQSIKHTNTHDSTFHISYLIFHVHAVKNSENQHKWHISLDRITFFNSTTLTTLSFGRVDTNALEKYGSDIGKRHTSQTHKSCTVMARCRGALGIIRKKHEKHQRIKKKQPSKQVWILCKLQVNCKLVNCWCSYDVSKTCLILQIFKAQLWPLPETSPRVLSWNSIPTQDEFL